MDYLEQNQVEIRNDMDAMKSKMEHMLDDLLAQPKNNPQHPIIENIGPTSGFTMMTNPVYGFPPDYAPPQVKIMTHLSLCMSRHIMRSQLGRRIPLFILMRKSISMDSSCQTLKAHTR